MRYGVSKSFALQAGRMSAFADYAKSTSRTIPIVLIDRVA